MPDEMRSLWVVFNTIFWVPLIGMPCMLSICLTPIFGLSVVQRLIWHCACVYFKIILWSFAVSPEIIGLENLDPHLNYIFTSNHVSTYDIPVIFSVNYFTGWFPFPNGLWCTSQFWVDRSGWVERYLCKDSITTSPLMLWIRDSVDSLRKRPKSVLPFPEGRRSDNGTLQEFNRGGFLVVIQCKMPVVPVALIGTVKIAGRNFSSLIEPIRPSHVTVVIGKPVETKSMTVGDRNDLASSLYTGI